MGHAGLAAPSGPCYNKQVRASRAAFLGLATLWALSTPACGCFSSAVKRPYPTPANGDVVAKLRQRNEHVKAFRAESVMDYRVSGERVKGTVLIAGKKGARIRFNAENPTGGNVAVDLACDGYGFKYINYNENCQLIGACSENAIASLLRVKLPPDDFMLMAVGGIPLIEHKSASVKWLGDKKREQLTLEGSDGSKQIIELSGNKDQRWDVVMAKRLNAAGKIEWKIQNKDFRTKQGEDGASFRVPGKTLFEQPMAKADLLVEWKKRELNLELPDQIFDMDIPEGLPVCGQKKK
jgi:outer membrane lipoprotein-sorting protein